MQIRRNRKNRRVPSLNMASMPDLIFTVLFFFMIVTHMRTEEVKVDVEVPQGSEVTKQSNRKTTLNIYIGKDSKGNPRIQVKDKLCDLYQISALVQEYSKSLSGGSSNSLSEEDQPSLTVNLRADRTIPMGMINDIKQELRKAGIQTIRYSATELEVNEE